MELLEFLQTLELTMVYWIVLGVGFLLLAFAFLLGGIFDFGDDGSMFPAICLFMVVFGAMGVLGLHLFGLGGIGSVLLAVGSGTVGSLLFYLAIWKGLKAQESSLADRREDMVGQTAEVSLPIGPRSTGQITYSTPSGRNSAPARSEDGAAIEQGEIVEIVKFLGTTYLVRPLRPRGEAGEKEKETEP